jgi:excisionase family DNA binding protein
VELVTIPEAAVLIGVSRTMAYTLANRGEIPTVNLGRRRVIVRAALMEWLEANPSAVEKLRRKR